MNPFEMVVIIVFLAIVAGMFSNWLKHRHSAPARTDEERMARLEERVRVLERIVTDSGYELRRKFRDLERDA